MSCLRQMCLATRMACAVVALPLADPRTLENPTPGLPRERGAWTERGPERTALRHCATRKGKPRIGSIIIARRSA